MKKVLLVVPLVLAVILGFFLFSLSTKTPYPQTAEEVPVAEPIGQDLQDIQGCLDNPAGAALTDCVKELLMRNVSLGKYGLALGQLRYASDADPIIAAGCHGYAHDMGLKVFEQGMPIFEIYKLGWNDCKMGFPHGAQIGASASMTRDNVAQEFEKLCFPLSEFGERAVGECAHLTGHTIADLWIEDIASGISSCGSIGEEYFNFCINGLIMRYAELIDLARISKDPQAMELVNTVWGYSLDEQLKTMTNVCSNDLEGSASAVCANSIPSLGAALWRDSETNIIDWVSVHKICEAFTPGSPEEEYCQKGIGAATISYITLPHELVLEACDQGKGYDNCVHTVANAIASHNPGGNPDELICSKVKKTAYSKCIEGFTQGVEIANSLQKP